MSQEINLANKLYYEYEHYKEPAFKQRRFKQTEVLPLIEKLKEDGRFKVDKIGLSAERRNIYLIKLGSGKTKIFFWSQMHGDESTATMALFDLFNFFKKEDELKELKEKILKQISLYFIPMLNPDGAEIFQRRTFWGIDINRDALRTETPEAQILKNTFDSIKADFGFNLHDQSSRYSAGRSFKSAALSFLAPPINYEKTNNSVRENSTKLITKIYQVLSEFIPGHLAKYPDDFEPRAFGDNFQKWGTSTILIESGGWKDDPEKMFVRKLNFIALLTAIYSVSNGSYHTQDASIYDEIPENEKFIFDLLLRNLTMSKNGVSFNIDIGINRTELNSADRREYYYSGLIEDIGDLSVFHGYEDYDLSGMEIVNGKIYQQEVKSLDEIEKLNFTDLLSQGYTYVILSAEKLTEKFTRCPINIKLKTSIKNQVGKIEVGENATFLIKDKGKVRFAVINGFLCDLLTGRNQIANGLVIF